MDSEAAPQQRYILLADDNVKLRCSIENHLTDIGYNVITAGDGKKALDIFTQNHKQLCLMIIDIFMPVLDGIALIHHVRQSDKDIPIMAITGYPSDGYNKMKIRKDLDNLNVPLFKKPLDYHAIEEHLASTIRHKECRKLPSTVLVDVKV